MAHQRGRHFDEETDPVDGGVFHSQEADLPDDAVVVDLRRDPESLNWLHYGPEDATPTIDEMTDEEVRTQVSEVRKRLRDVRMSNSEGE